MSRANVTWTVLFLVGGVFLAGRAMFSEHGMGKAYLKAVPVQADHASGGWLVGLAVWLRRRLPGCALICWPIPTPRSR